MKKLLLVMAISLLSASPALAYSCLKSVSTEGQPSPSILASAEIAMKVDLSKCDQEDLGFLRFVLADSIKHLEINDPSSPIRPEVKKAFQREAKRQRAKLAQIDALISPAQ